MPNSFAEHYAFRAQLVEQLERDLVGPTDPAEVEIITDRPITKYAAGILFPQSSSSVEQDTVVDSEQASTSVDTDFDPAVSMANVRYPSSMGLTFAVDTRATDSVVLAVEAARYFPEGAIERVWRRSTDQTEERWRRQPLKLEPVEIPVTEPKQFRRMVHDDLELFVRVRGRDDRGAVAVTVALINTRAVSPDGNRDEAAFFQPRLTVSGPEGKPVLLERVRQDDPEQDEEIAASNLLYRHAPTFAVGHGCAVTWDEDPVPLNHLAAERSTTSIRTTFVPRYELLLADSNPDIDTELLGMAELGAPDSRVVHALRSLTEGYRGWIADRRLDAARIEQDGLRQVAEAHLDICAETCARMEEGIDLLGGEVLEAFRLMNRAMAMQRARTDWLRGGRRTPPPQQGSGWWRPFQIAFILLSLKGIVDKNSDDRRIADLLWFPTGGGKTEAYLGLIAFTTFLRRLRDPNNGGGVTVLMRYTLRLLTAQQFERAALLICCMELLRRQDPTRLGSRDAQISIGMWVGKAATPNRLSDAKTSLNKLRKGKPLQEENPVQLRSCPWCGAAMDHHNYEVGADALVVACATEGCEFAEGLPVHLVDETIYRHRPTLIIATADKFASIAWNGSVAELFNLTTPEPPPELIIQDELHLISGPLGTLTGLYEAAIDLAADHPKIVASTATIRRAEKQGKALFNRAVRQFPPPGIDARDSYFSVTAPPDRKATRLYVGAMTPATSQTTLLVRTYAALLHYANALPATPRVCDPYWTLLGYFNSLRLLAGARLQVQDDVDDRLELLSSQSTEPRRQLERTVELTSREPSSAIPQHLQDMAVSLTDGDPIDVILATNMISVGVDIDRLGLMAVMGQPQSTSEYIQASSRVGRQWPGLVVTMFNSTRSRDRSHYENFVSYHSALYRQVEATSVTPFSARARDRGLHAVVVGLARLLIPAARPDQAAALVEDFRDELWDHCRSLLDRVSTVAPKERLATELQLDEIIDHWVDLAEADDDLVYSEPSSRTNGRRPALLVDAGHYDEANDEIAQCFPTLRSLRDVDVESKLFVKRERP